MQAAAIAYFFALALLAAAPVWAAYRLQTRYRHAWLPAYTLYLASWGALALLAAAQYVLAGLFLPGSALGALQLAMSPLWSTILAFTLFFLSSFMARLTGLDLSRRYALGYAAACCTVAALLVIRGQQVEGAQAGWAVASGVALFVARTAVIYGWIVVGLRRIGRMDDPLERRGLRRFVLLFLGGWLAFEFAMRDGAAVFGFRTSDVAIGFVHVTMNVPALLWLARFLRRHALARPNEPFPDDSRARLVALGLSARETDVIELVLVGFSHKEIAERLFIAPDTVKKHTYNAYRKLGVQNRLQLSYFVQNRVGRR